jgi:radical SAM family uncharacterized protein
MLDEDTLSQVLSGVERPGRYIGGEVNCVRKDFDSARFRLALAFPDIYDIAMSHLGLQILYAIVNSRNDALAERVFMPWPDMERAMAEAGAPLFSLENHRSVKDFDAVGFSLQYEVCFPTVLRMLDLAGIPRRRDERRRGRYPLVIAGGPCTADPEPLAEFIDLFFVGDAEESLPAFIDAWMEASGKGPKAVVEAAVRKVPGIYAPEMYEVRNGAAEPVSAGVPQVVWPAVVRDFDGAPYPTAPVIPFVEAVHERIALEIMRGCSRGCRFCQAGMTKRPVRSRSVGKLLELADAAYRHTGFDEISLLSLATGDYPHLTDLCRRLNHRFSPEAVSLSFPSLRADEALAEIPGIMAEVRKGAITVAAEAGSERLRAVINKGITEKGILDGLGGAFRAGWNRVKLYFMAGLPTETAEDVEAIAELIEKILSVGEGIRRYPQVNCSVAPFVPKAGTPFQWEPMASREYLEEARNALFQRLPRGPVKLSFHNLDRSFIEGALARGGREIGPVLEKAADLGCSLDAWDECFDYAKWREAFASEGLDVEEYACRRLVPEAHTAWGHISPGVSSEFLLQELKKAGKGLLTADCRNNGCQECGAGCGAHQAL